MATSALTPYLPLIGAVVGGIVGAWANSLYRNRETKKAEDEETRSLMFLIDTEVGFNAWRLEAISKGPPANVIPFLRTDVWDMSQARLAHLLPIAEVKMLAPYYEQVRMLKAFDIASKDDPRQVSEIEWQLIQETQERGFVASQLAQEYVQDPDYRNPADIIARQSDESGGPAAR